MTLESYSVNRNPSTNAEFVDLLSEALKLEKSAKLFYSDAARLSVGLLATISIAFKRMAEKREMREQELKSLFHKAKMERTTRLTL